MSPENDQTRWIGIRPVNPAENIPVTESTPLTSIQVEPKEATTEFKTLTEKRSPAIADLQAIECVVQFHADHTMVGAGNYDGYSGTVPSGKLWVVAYIYLHHNDTVARSCWINIAENTTTKCLLELNVALATNESLLVKGVIVLDEGQRIRFRFSSMANGKHCYSDMSAYQVNKY